LPTLQSPLTAAGASTTQALVISFNRHFSSVRTPLQRCESLAALHKAVEMGHNLIPDPAGMQLATDTEVEQLLPFSWNIAQFRGRRIGERGLIVHYKPQASHAVGHEHAWRVGGYDRWISPGSSTATSHPAPMRSLV
jgi:hypothetical protein